MVHDTVVIGRGIPELLITKRRKQKRGQRHQWLFV